MLLFMNKCDLALRTDKDKGVPHQKKGGGVFFYCMLPKIKAKIA